MRRKWPRWKKKADYNSDSPVSAEAELDERSSVALRVLGYALIFNVLIIFGRGLTGDTWVSAITYSITSVVVACAALLVGVLVGFLFGIPRAAAQQEDEARSRKDASAGSRALNDDEKEEAELERRRDNGYRPNTNLEQISDWLTKILVGVGLTNLAQIPSALSSLSASAAPAFGTFSGNNVYALGVMLFFSVCGFLIGFLWARIYLPLAFALSDRDVLKLTRRVFRRIVDAQAERDIQALRIAQRQLDLADDALDIPQEELDRCLDGASPTALEQIFYRARNIRQDNWRNPDKLQLMARTIPIFRALNAEDKKKRFHTILGQLGFALADKQHPSHAEAIKVLTEAIERRGPWKDAGWVHYELVRATSRIKLLRESGQVASPEDVAAITSDLRVLAQSPISHFLDDAVIKSFLGENRISRESLQ